MTFNCVILLPSKSNGICPWDIFLQTLYLTQNFVETDLSLKKNTCGFFSKWRPFPWQVFVTRLKCTPKRKGDRSSVQWRHTSSSNKTAVWVWKRRPKNQRMPHTWSIWWYVGTQAAKMWHDICSLCYLCC